MSSKLLADFISIPLHRPRIELLEIKGLKKILRGVCSKILNVLFEVNNSTNATHRMRVNDALRT